jgi:hypothetical protein
MLSRSATLYLSLVLLVVGLVLTGSGLLLVLGGVKVYYQYIDYIIPVYRFERVMPGNYTETVPRSIEMLHAVNITSPAKYVYVVEVSTGNCTGGDSIGLAIRGRIDSTAATPSVLVEIYGCRGGECTQLYSQDILKLNECYHGDSLFGCKTEVNLTRSILEYDRIEFNIAPSGSQLFDFMAGSEIACTYNYTIECPWIKPILDTPRFYAYSVPTYVDTSNLVQGLALSIAGLALMILGIFVKLYSTR